MFSVILLGNSSGTLPVSGNVAFVNKVIVATGDSWISIAEANGYDQYRRIGMIPLLASTNLIAPFSQSGMYNDRFYQLADAIQVLNAGNATSETAIDVSIGAAYVPANFASVQLQVAYTPNSAGNIMSLTPANLTGTVAPVRVKASGAAQVIQMVEVDVNEDGNLAEVDYKVGNSSDAATVYLAGIKETLNLYNL